MTGAFIAVLAAARAPLDGQPPVLTCRLGRGNGLSYSRAAKAACRTAVVAGAHTVPLLLRTASYFAALSAQGHRTMTRLVDFDDLSTRLASLSATPVPPPDHATGPMRPAVGSLLTRRASPAPLRPGSCSPAPPQARIELVGKAGAPPRPSCCPPAPRSPPTLLRPCPPRVQAGVPPLADAAGGTWRRPDAQKANSDGAAAIRQRAWGTGAAHFTSAAAPSTAPCDAHCPCRAAGMGRCRYRGRSASGAALRPRPRLPGPAAALPRNVYPAVRPRRQAAMQPCRTAAAQGGRTR